MKTQWINIGHVLSGINNLIITIIMNLEWHKLLFTSKVSPNKIGDYLLPIIKQLFRDNFMGSEIEMAILLLFIKNYFLWVAYAISHNTLSDRFKILWGSASKILVANQKNFYQHKQVA